MGMLNPGLQECIQKYAQNNPPQHRCGFSPGFLLNPQKYPYLMGTGLQVRLVTVECPKDRCQFPLDMVRNRFLCTLLKADGFRVQYLPAVFRHLPISSVTGRWPAPVGPGAQTLSYPGG